MSFHVHLLVINGVAVLQCPILSGKCKEALQTAICVHFRVLATSFDISMQFRQHFEVDKTASGMMLEKGSNDA